MKFRFDEVARGHTSESDWNNWIWQIKTSASTKEEFQRHFNLNEVEQSYFSKNSPFKAQATPYYIEVAKSHTPIRKILLPTGFEHKSYTQQMSDPLGERKHSPTARLVHRYPDRVLFLITDICSVYCRFCTRKYFTGQEQAFIKNDEYERALTYIRTSPQIREVILSGGDPLTVSDKLLLRTVRDLRSIDHVEIIRIGSRMPVVCPMRITPELATGLREYAPVFVMSHFNHPKELTADSVRALGLLVDHGVPVFNQMVLLNGVNNHPAIVQALSRRLLFLRVKPYYMFQCDPSLGSDHMRTSVDESLEIQRALWGRLSGLALPNLSLDIPDGGGKVGLVPEFEVFSQGAEKKTLRNNLANGSGVRYYRGFDGVEGKYINPDPSLREIPADVSDYMAEFESLNK